jgi:hypothetical protein
MFKNKRILGLVLACVLMVFSSGLYIYSLGASHAEPEAGLDERVSQAPESLSESSSEKEPSKDSEKDASHSSSKELAQNHSSEDGGSHESAAHEEAIESHDKESSLKSQAGHASHGESDKGHESKAKEELLAQEAKPEELKNKYRPRIIGRCKVLFNQFTLQKLDPGQYHAFAYSFDGKSGYCADSGAQSSMRVAQEVALKDCEKNKENVDGYAPCFIYSNN